MKLTVHIFTIYMLALSLVPCGDGGGGIVEVINHFFEIEQQHISDHEEHSNDCGDDTCSPFCICSCCSASIDTPSDMTYINRHIFRISKQMLSLLSSFYPHNFHFSIWHPPKYS